MSGYANAFDVFDHHLRDRKPIVAGSQPSEPPSLERNVFLAASRNQTGRLKAILSSSTTIDLTLCINGLTALHSAAKKGYIDICRMIIDYHVDQAELQQKVLTATTDDGEKKTALMIAAYNGQLPVVELLTTFLQASSVSNPDGRGNTPLHYAAWGGHLPCVQYLVNNCQISTHISNSEGLTPLQLAAAGNFYDIVEFLTTAASSSTSSLQTDIPISENISSSGMTSLHRAASHGAFETVRFLLQHQHDGINVQAFNGNTALHYAAHHGHDDIVQLLTSQPDIQLALQNEYGLAPLHYACITGRPTIVAHLLSLLSRAEITLVNGQGENCLQLAAAAGEHEVCRLLLEDSRQLFDVFAEDNKHASAIDKAIESGYKELANKLVLYACFQHKRHELMGASSLM